MFTCPKCHEQNPIEARSCNKCGTPFYKPSQLPIFRKTQTIEFVPEKSVIKRLVEFFKRSDADIAALPNPVSVQPTPAASSPKRPNTPPYIRSDYNKDYSTFVRGNSIVLRIGDQKVVVNKVRRDILLGRVTSSSKIREQYVTVNLMKYVGLRTGVSRVHALIRPSNDSKLMLIDLNSTNGTRLNRRPCVPFKTYVLYDGDEIQLADVVMTIQYLQSRAVTLELTPVLPPVSIPATPHIVNTTKPLSPKLVEAPPSPVNSGKPK